VAQLKSYSFSRNDCLPLAAHVLWRIDTGAVRTATWNEEGTLLVLGYWGTGELVGQLLSRIKPYEIQCLTNVEVSLLPQAVWEKALEPMILHVQQAEELLMLASCNPMSQRLWKFLVFLSQKFGRDVDSGRMIDLVLTHQELAEAINTTRVTVTRILQQFESEGRVRRHQRRLVLCR
jgi:CRP-like cAMP-binding protein